MPDCAITATRKSEGCGKERPMDRVWRGTRRVSDVLLALVGVRVFLWVSVVAKALPSLLTDPRKLAYYHDEHFWYAHDDSARITLAKFHQLPAWNPFYCGGVPGIGNPQDATYAPETLFRLWLGVGPGRRLAYFFLFIVGMEGFYRLARRHDASAIGAAMAAIVFALCSFFLDMIRLGWLSFFSFQLLPWVVFAFYEGLRSWPWRIAGGLFIAWMVLQGGLYAVPYTVIVLGVLVATTTATIIFRKQRPLDLPASAPLLAFTVIGVVAVLASAAKLFPTMIVVKSLPRLWLATEALPWNDIVSRLIKPGIHDGQPAYIGGYVLVLALLGAAFDRRAAGFVGLAGVFFVIALGDFAEWSPHSLLHKLPVIEQLRFPHRFVICIAFFFCLAFARTLTRLEDAIIAIGRAVHAQFFTPLRPRMHWAIGVALGIAAAAGAYRAARAIYDDTMNDARIEPSTFNMDGPFERDAPFHQSRGNRWDAQVFAPASLGSLQCFEETAFVQSAKLRGDLLAEEYPLDPALATVTRTEWTPNRIKLHVVATGPTTILVNQNWARSWRSNVGSVRNHEGLLAIDVPAGTHELVVRYRDQAVFLGLGTSIVTLLVLAVLGVRYLRNKWSASGV
jgi:hypothetical protein